MCKGWQAVPSERREMYTDMGCLQMYQKKKKDVKWYSSIQLPMMLFETVNHDLASVFILGCVECMTNKINEVEHVIFFVHHLSGFGLQDQLPQEGSPDYPLPCNFLQLLWEDIAGFSF